MWIPIDFKKHRNFVTKCLSKEMEKADMSLSDKIIFDGITDPDISITCYVIEDDVVLGFAISVDNKTVYQYTKKIARNLIEQYLPYSESLLNLRFLRRRIIDGYNRHLQREK